MPMIRSGGDELHVIDGFDGGVGWIAHPGEMMRRASHAVKGKGGLWIVDPVDAEGLDEVLSEYGDPAGVIVLLDRHKRDSAVVANRHDVAVHVPEWMRGVAGEIDAPIERFDQEVGGFRCSKLIDNPLWREATLFDGETLLVPESLGTVSYFTAPSEELGVHPILRVTPPKRLGDYDPERLLVGHGEGIDEAVGTAMRRAIERSRRTAVPLYLKKVGGLLGLR